MARISLQRSGPRTLWMGGSPPSLITHEEPSTYQPASHLFRASEPLLVLRASEIQIWYWFRWKLTPTFQVPSTTFLQPSWSLFQHTPSQQSCNIYIYNIIYIHRPFHKVHSHHTFTFLSLPQSRFNIFTNIIERMNQ